MKAIMKGRYMRKIEYMKLRSIYVVLFGVMLVVGAAQAGSGAATQVESLDSIVAGTQQRISHLSEQLQNYKIQAERERNNAQTMAKAADMKVSQARNEMIRAKNLLEQLSSRQGASIDLNHDSSVDDIVNETQRQVVQLTVQLQRVQIDAEREKKAAESRINDVQFKIDQLMLEKRRVEELMGQLSTSSAPVSASAPTSGTRSKLVNYPPQQTTRNIMPLTDSYGFAGQQVMVLGDVLFNNNSAKLKYTANMKIQQVVDHLLKNPERKVLIAGHTDQYGKADYNQGLSERRARSVFHALLERGVPFDQLRVAGFGETRPKINSKHRDANIQNRRVEIVILN
jgi:outer membrane protein OmpA-like peptidoglycan-associated protein